MQRPPARPPRPHEGYTRYFHTDRATGLCWMKYPQPEGAWRRAASEALQGHHASCLWHALLWILPEDDFDVLYQEQTAFRDKFSRGWSIAEVQGLLVGAGVDLNIYQVLATPQGGIVHVIREADHPGKGLIYLPVNDAGEVRPHWACCTAVFDLNVHIWSYQEHDLLFPAAAPPPPPPQPPVMFGPHFPGPVVAPAPRPPPLWNPVPVNHRLNTYDHPLKSMRRAVGRIPPPVPSAFRDCSLRLEYHFHDVGATAVDPGVAVYHRGWPDAIDRAFDAVMGSHVAYQLCPEVMLSGHVSLKHGTTFFYMHLGTVDPDTGSVRQTASADRKLLTTGDYNPEFLGRISADGGTWALVDPVDLTGDKRNAFRVFRVERVATSTLGALLNLVPFMGDTPTVVLTRDHGQVALPQRSEFTTEELYLVSVYTMLMKKAPEDKKGVISDQRNRVMALYKEGKLPAGFDPVATVTALINADEFAGRFWNTPAGAKAQ